MTRWMLLVEASRYAKGILALNAISCGIITAMTLILDWHLDIRIPAYKEFSWIGITWCFELGKHVSFGYVIKVMLIRGYLQVAIVLSGISVPREVCSINENEDASKDSVVFKTQVRLGRAMCSNWQAGFVTMMMTITLCKRNHSY